MSTSARVSPFRKRVSLTVLVSGLLILAVILPLVITVVGSELILRPTLVSQATTEMGNDAQSHAQSIDALLIARLQDLGSLGQFFAIQRFLSGNNAYKEQALNELALGYRLDVNYSAWTLFTPNGDALLSYPALPAPRGKYMVAPEILAQLQTAHKTLISDVYFNNNTHTAYIDIYTSIATTNGNVLGIGRSTLNLTDIWTAVNNETNAASGSYAMIIDGHGVRVGYTNPDTTLTTLPPGLFKAVAPLSAQFRQQITDEDLYGDNEVAVNVVPDGTLANLVNGGRATSTFQFQPALQTENFQAYQVRCQIVPWTYVVLRPVHTITGAADQQDLYLFLLAAVITIVAAIVGLVVGRAITRPILRSVASLTKSSEMLKTLAAREQVTATEQKWIVESSQSGLQGVQYYAEASNVASRKLSEIGQDFTQNLENMNALAMKQRLYEIIETARYLEKASVHQERSSKGLSTAIRITTQVTEQLLSGATSASDAATQLEDVITQLRRVVGE